MPTSSFWIDKAVDFIFSLNTPFSDKAIQVFHHQYRHNELYKRYVDAINCHPESVKSVEDIPFLPISFFKSHQLIDSRLTPETIFESSGTTGALSSKHYVADAGLYEESFMRAFEHFYGSIHDYCILGLLPSYLERKGSSLVYMVEKWMQKSNHPLNGFHLYDHEQLAKKLKELEAEKQKTLLIGVTYALLDFAASFQFPLKHTIVMETGGMKGKKRELLRSEVHQQIKKAFSISSVHSEYGMTELLSQAYSLNDGIFNAPHWMKIAVREEDDPLLTKINVAKPTTGAVNVIDLANIHSCSFIATDDIGRLYPDGSFEILGRMDNSDIRGCSLLAI